MIEVQPMGKRYGISIEAGKEKVTFIFSQLSYFARNKVSTKSVTYSGGKMYLDVGLAVFYNLKYGLKDVKGLFEPVEEGKDPVPYKLEFEEGLDELTDNCVDELLALPFSDDIIYAARDLGAHIPEKIYDPVSGEEVKGIEVIPPEKLNEGTVKKS